MEDCHCCKMKGEWGNEATIVVSIYLSIVLCDQRSIAKVVWSAGGSSTNIYRVGHKGKVMTSSD